MKKTILSLFLLSLYFTNLNAQINKGINFQGVARNSNGIILANKIIGLRLSIKNDSLNGVIEYQEIKSITTNAIGLFSVVVGSKQDRNIISIGNFENINWSNTEKYLQVEVDVTGELYFSSIGIQKINYVPYAFYADKVDAVNINGIIGVKKGGTGFDNIKDFKIMAAIDKVNNTPDSLKPITKNALSLINQKLNSVDTISFSNRLNLKLNKIDTISLSNRIQQKLNKSDTLYLSDRIEALSKAIPSPKEWGYFYDTSRHTTTVNSATVVQWNFSAASNTATITNNTAGQPTRVTIQAAGVYKVFFKLQIIKLDIGNDELSIWIRKNNAAYPNTHQVYTIQGGAVKNSFMGNYFLDLGDRDYIEIFYSVRNAHAVLMSSPTLNSPSRPATPSAYLLIEKIN